MRMCLKNRTTRQASESQQGFSILEVLMTIVVIGILFGAIIMLFSNVLIVQSKTHNLETATRAAHRQIEALRNLQYNSLEDGENIDFSDDLPDKLPEGSTGLVEVEGAQQGLKRVNVSVTYPEGNGEQVVTVSSLIGIIGITQ